MIPEEVVSLTSVTTLKTASFTNDFGSFDYQSVNPSCFFGYEPKMMHDGRAWLMATPEKALIDLLYLNPYYKTAQDMEELRLDEDFMQTELNRERLVSYMERMNHKALSKRMNCLLKIYGL